MTVKQFNFECEIKLCLVQQIVYHKLTIVHNPQCECMGVGYTMARLSKLYPQIMMIQMWFIMQKKKSLLVWKNYYILA